MHLPTGPWSVTPGWRGTRGLSHPGFVHYGPRQRLGYHPFSAPTFSLTRHVAPSPRDSGKVPNSDSNLHFSLLERWRFTPIGTVPDGRPRSLLVNSFVWPRRCFGTAWCCRERLPGARGCVCSPLPSLGICCRRKTLAVTGSVVGAFFCWLQNPRKFAFRT